MKNHTALMLIATTLALAACGRAPDIAAPVAAAEPPDPTGGLAPPLIEPGEGSAHAQPPSYEVSIASTAADHNKALERCMKQPSAVRTSCEQEANAAFADAEKNLEPLRGNQQ